MYVSHLDEYATVEICKKVFDDDEAAGPTWIFSHINYSSQTNGGKGAGASTHNSEVGLDHFI